jgi:hypothetical protein
MSGTTPTRGGWLRFKELTALSKPLAVLLVLLFSLTIHINSALAAGGENSICAATRAMNNADKNTPSQQIQIEHCGICIVSIQFKSFGLQNLAVTIDTTMEVKVTSFVLEIPDTANIKGYFQIRAPPFS